MRQGTSKLHYVRVLQPFAANPLVPVQVKRLRSRLHLGVGTNLSGDTLIALTDAIEKL